MNYLGLSDEDFQPCEIASTVYENFKQNLYSEGTILWREDTEACKVIVMNDYHSTTGEFKVFCYSAGLIF